MKKAGLVAFVLILLSLIPSLIKADGMMMVDWEKVRDEYYIKEPEQKGVICFYNGMETLMISPSYEGSVENFAWVVPVPAKPEIAIQDAAIFKELADATRVRLSSAEPPSTSKPKVEVIERVLIGDYDVSVLASNDSKALMKWLSDNKYHLPENAVKPMQSYIDKKWTFVACKVVVPEAAKKLNNGTLAPLCLTFPAKRPVYPLKLSSANPEPFDLLIYLITPVIYNDPGSKMVTLDKGSLSSLRLGHGMLPCWDNCLSQDEMAKLYPTLAKITNVQLAIYTLANTICTQKLRPEDCTHDLYWNVYLKRKNPQPEPTHIW